jgi:CheY-like chemotaxis protein
MVYGFVKQSGGHVTLYSEEGHGTTVKIYLPRLLSEEAVEEEATLTPGLETSRRQETILVVEDDDDVRAYTVECLRELGYRVLEAHDGVSGLRLIERQSDPIDLLFTDVVMPNMTGRELADKAREAQPGLKVLYTSGYTRDAIIHGGRLDPGVDMIAKPFTYHALGQQVRDMLDRGRTGRLLVVQGDAAVRTLTIEALEEAGYAPDQAATGIEALSKIRAAQGMFDAVVLDSGLNDKSPTGLVQEVRAIQSDLAILVTTEGESERPEEAADDPCLRHIAKPYTFAQLKEALSELGVRCQRQGRRAQS